jgi:PIN domain nuclease of toxin-antitoxin system
MKLLLDTHVLLWAAGQPEKLSTEATALLNDPQNELLFSAASIWEIVIKHSLGWDDFKANASQLRRGLLDNGYTELPITSDHTLALESLPPIHKDPFDRLLIAQAITEGILLLTADSLLTKYPGPALRV